jgi:primosomal protein N' (replication factor Y)
MVRPSAKVLSLCVQYVDVILPLALPGLLTYAVPPEHAGSVRVGSRVVVPLRGKRLHTAVVRTIHDRKPEHRTEAFVSLLDAEPLLSEVTLGFWDWMAGHYCCSPGEVALAALPAGMRLASETKLQPAPDAEERDDSGLEDREFQVVEALRLRGAMTFKEVGELLGVKDPAPVLRSLVESGWILSNEEMRSGPGRKVVSMVRVSERAATDEAWLGEQLDHMDARAPAQSRAMMALLDDPRNRSGVPVAELVKKRGLDAQVFKRLVDKGVVFAFKQDPWMSGAEAEDLPLADLSPAQSRAAEAIRAGMADKGLVLLEGVTGSGKTEVYTHLIHDTLAEGRDALFLVPEIALTTQLIVRLRRFFGDRLEVYHSRFTPRERTTTFRRVAQERGKGRLLVGARSAVFLPFHNLGLIVVDEEHDPSYKQQDPAPRYQARDAAAMLGRLHGASVVLGSATPSLEARWAVDANRAVHVPLKERFGGTSLPAVELVDLRKAHKQRRMEGHFSRTLLDAIGLTLEAGRQVILFQNRRGYAPVHQCRTCGWVPECARCDVSLTYHKYLKDLHCHYCGYRESEPRTCPRCGSEEVESKGIGTERIEEEIATHFPDIKSARMDLDTTRTRSGHERIIRAFETGEVQVLVGTQMVTKGLDFEHVGLVGILQADRMLHHPDFRALERTFQLLTQVAGRAGRREDQGRVLIQTFDPEHWVFNHVVRHDAVSMAKAEMQERRTFQYPPVIRLIRLVLRHRDPHKVRHGASALAGRLRSRFGGRVIGPEEPQIPRINDQYHRHILLKFEREASPGEVKALMKEDIEAFRGVEEYRAIRIIVDVDPY